MPDLPPGKLAPHPSRSPRPARLVRPARAAWAEIEVSSNFSFLRGASHPEELVRRAAELGLRGLALTDRASLAGVVRAHVAAAEVGLPLALGTRLDFAGGGGWPVLVYATDRRSYGRLARLLTRGKLRAPKGQCDLAPDDLFAFEEGLLCVALPPEPGADAEEHARFAGWLARLRAVFDDDRLSLAGRVLCGAQDERALLRLAELARARAVPLVAANDVHLHDPARRALQDVLTCIREKRTIEQAGLSLFPNAERRVQAPDTMARRFAYHPAALARAVELIERAAAFSLDELRFEYPDEVAGGRSAMEELRGLTARGARERYPRGLPAKVRRQLEHELALIEELAYAPYFLTVADLVRFARAQGILCQGRGAAANSAVCYCLGVTSVDPDRIDILFERFVSKERGEPPDIDVDFEHERREEVIQYVYGKYGRERAALTAEVVSYRGRSAVREVGKALGLSADCVDLVAREVDWWHDPKGLDERLVGLGLDPEAPTLRPLVRLTRELLGFPRHLSQHVGGFVVTRGLLSELVPIGNAAMPARTMIEWDKDDLDALGILKVDVLGLGILTCLRKSFALAAGGGPPLELHTLPAEDPAVYDMLCAADTVGVFQIESRAQMSMLPRLRPRTFYDLVIEVAIVRPGPIQGKMVHPYLRRRAGEEPATYPDEAVRRVLGKTLGVPLFQEQAMALAVVAAGFTPSEADRLRRAMAAWKRKGDVFESLGQKLVGGMLARGYEPAFAERCLEQLRGFSEYGFPESHAASFALLVYASAWMKLHHPAAFAAALINSQPMGFYAPAQIVSDARAHGVEVHPIDVNHSDWDCTLEERARGPALRLGTRLVKGLGAADGRRIAAAVRAHGPFDALEPLQSASGVSPAALRRLAYASAFGSLGLDRQAGLWAVRALHSGARGELPFRARPSRAAERLPVVPPLQRVLHDYAATFLSLEAHPISFLRAELEQAGAVTSAVLRDAARLPHGRAASVAGIVLSRQRPSTAGGILFLSVEDECGVSNLIVRPHVFERSRSVARHASALLAHGRVERQGQVVHLLVRALESLDERIDGLASTSRDFR
jgi:error-prone DNA polymerase